MSTMNKNQSTAKALILALALILLGGFALAQATGSDQITEDQDPAIDTSANIGDRAPDDYASIDFSTWQRQDDKEIDGIASTNYIHQNGAALLATYLDSPIIFYSSNTTNYCALEDGSWIHHGSDGEHTPDESNACSSIEESQIDGSSAYSKYGGGDRQTTYSVAINVDDAWFVFREYYNSDTTNSTDAETANIQDILRTGLDQIIADTLL